MTRRRARPATLTAAPLLATLLLLVAGCTDPGVLTSTGSAATSAPEDASGEPGTDGAGADGDATGGDCPIGDWVLDNDSWRVALQGFVDASMGGGVVEVSGSSDLEWAADGAYRLEARESVAVIRGSADGQEFVQTIRHHGTEVGVWSGSGSAYRLTGTDASDYVSTATIEAGGTAYSAAAPAEPWSGDLAVSCEGGVLATTVSDDGVSMTVEWTRR